MRKYTKEILEQVVSKNFTLSDVIRKLNLPLQGGNFTHIAKLIKDFNIDTTHFIILKLKSQNNKKRTPKEILVLDRFGNGRKENADKLRRSLIESNVQYICTICKNNGLWNNTKLVLQIDHIDGNNLNNTIENLRFLCPNCHTQTSNYGSKNKQKNIIYKNVCGVCGKLTNNKYYCSRKCCSSVPVKNRYYKVKNRPSKNELKELINNLSWSAIGRKYGVSDNCIRKWAKSYQLI